jgi:translocation and assembly module TamA
VATLSDQIVESAAYRRANVDNASIVISAARLFVLVLLLACTAAATADELRYAVDGIDDPLKANVLSHVDTFQLGRPARLSENDYVETIATGERRARAALRPYGYYNPAVKGSIRKGRDGALLLTLGIRIGLPVVIESARIEIIGDGTRSGKLQEWHNNWPLNTGSVLNQVTWEEQKGLALEIARARGFLSATFSRHSLELDLERNVATLDLELDTGPQFVFGDINFGEHALKPGILESIPRFERGEAYSTRLLDEFRLDLWKTGYFSSIDVIEIEQSESVPPVVNLRVDLETLHKNIYQGSLGVGSDTGLRLQTLWTRNPMSRNGDRLDFGFGWQEADDEFSIRGHYRLPRRSRNREYWTLELFQRFENVDLEIKRQPEDEDFINIANGDIKEFNVRAGRLKIRNRKSGSQQLFTTPFVQYLNSSREFIPLIPIPPSPTDSGNGRFLVGTDNALSIGIDADLVAVQGRAWETHGRHDRLWVFAGDNSIAESHEFAQFYISTRRVYRKGQRWKFLLRGELGFSSAEVDSLVLELPDEPDEPVELSITRLPNFYRFKAGGSLSVRGYGFEELSNNDIGSNNIVTASAEVEFRVLERWSAAAFFDIGNAFNDWDQPELRKGVGVGVRWYSIAGPIRVDVAKALDVEGKPWRLHFTIGTPLL